VRTDFATLVLLGSGLLGACGDGGRTGTEPIVDRVRWRADDEPTPQVSAYRRGRSQILRPAQAPAAGVERPTLFASSRALRVTLQSGGDIYMRGVWWSASRGEWETWFRGAIRTERSGHRDLPLRLFVDIGWSWGDVARIVELARGEPPDGPLQVRIPLTNPDVTDGLLDLRLAADAPSGPPSAADVTLDVVDRVGATHPRVRLGERTWEFPSGNPYARGPSLDEANAAWVEIHTALAAAVPSVPDAASATPALGLRIDPRAPWPHTVQLLALAHLAGWRRLRVDSLASGVEVELSSPPDPPLARRWRVGLPSDPLASEPSDSRDLTPATSALLAIALAAVVVFGPPLLSRLRRRRR
jgi:hypothetical protein